MISHEPAAQAGIGRKSMLRKLTIALMVLTVTVLPLMATCVLTADAAQPAAYNTCGHLTVPFAGVFSGKYVAQPGGTSYDGTGFFTYCGWSKVEGSQIVTYPPAPYQMTIKTVKGDISLSVPFGSSIYHINGGTGRFVGASGSGHLSLHQSAHGTFTGYLDGTIVLA
jgi:hypothetical protein